MLKVCAWVLILGLLILTIVPAADRPETGLQHDLEHFLAFGLAGIVVALAYPNRLLVLLLAAAMFTLALELIQIPLPARHARLEDFAVDTLGACGAIALAYLARSFARTKLLGKPRRA
jgi:VanZ family protein